MLNTHQFCHELSCNAHSKYPRGMANVGCSCDGGSKWREELQRLKIENAELRKLAMTIREDKAVVDEFLEAVHSKCADVHNLRVAIDGVYAERFE